MVDPAMIIEVATGLAGACLFKLVQIGHATKDQVTVDWYVEISDVRLVSRELFAAASIDGHGRPVIYIRSNAPLKALMYAIAHETVHLMQICKGDLVPEYGRQFWKGTPYPSLPADDPTYLTAQPWEAEAAELQPILWEDLQRRFPTES